MIYIINANIMIINKINWLMSIALYLKYAGIIIYNTNISINMYISNGIMNLIISNSICMMKCKDEDKIKV